MTSGSASSFFGGKTFESTIGPADVPRTNGQVWSFGFFRVNTTVLSSGAATDFMLPSSDDGPFGLAMSTTRWNENATSFAVSGSPLENFRPDFILQVYSVGLVNEQLSAASGCGAFSPAGTCMRNW